MGRSTSLDWLNLAKAVFLPPAKFDAELEQNSSLNTQRDMQHTGVPQ
jgi:hypothetical protein